ncbi:hypothetical protein [Ornithinimicrobium kibberense]|uniref:hypothetical protein n=1 Tax=Ornithinimicrobium kibberense TaxID=282060 RepID=UPI0036165760
MSARRMRRAAPLPNSARFSAVMRIWSAMREDFFHEGGGWDGPRRGTRHGHRGGAGTSPSCGRCDTLRRITATADRAVSLAEATPGSLPSARRGGKSLRRTGGLRPGRRTWR